MFNINEHLMQVRHLYDFSTFQNKYKEIGEIPMLSRNCNPVIWEARYLYRVSDLAEGHAVAQQRRFLLKRGKRWQKILENRNSLDGIS